MGSPVLAPKRVRFGVYEVDLRALELRKNGLKVRLQDQPFQILAMLLERPGEVVTREDLRQKLWPADTFVDFDHSLNTAINKIREALGDSADIPRYVETLPRRGYRFIAPVEAPGRAATREPPSPEGPPAPDSVPGPAPSPAAVSLAAGLAIGVILLMVAATVYLLARRSSVIDSVAVLPFAGPAADPATQELTDGITENLIHNLSQVPNLRVIAFSSTNRYRGRLDDLQAVGRELGARAVLTGKVIERSGGLDIRMELVDVEDRSHIWGGQYEGRLADILMVQEEVTREISESLRQRQTGEELKRTEAFQLYLKGRSYWNKRTANGLKQGIEFLQQAVAKDQNHPLAYAALADSYNMLARYGASPPREAYPQAKAAAERALQLDEKMAEAHAALAFVKHRYEWDWPGAEVEFRRAIELRSNYAPAHQWYSSYLVAMGRVPEAVAEARLTRKLDPLSLITSSQLSWVLYQARDYPQAIQQCQMTIDLDPNFFVAHRYLGLAYVQRGLHDEAISELERAAALAGGSPLTLGELAYAYGQAGRKTDARKILEELNGQSRKRYVSPYYFATAYTGLGEKDQALSWLEKAFDDRADELVFLKVEPRFDSLRSEARFRDLLRRMKFPQ